MKTIKKKLAWINLALMIWASGLSYSTFGFNTRLEAILGEADSSGPGLLWSYFWVSCPEPYQFIEALLILKKSIIPLEIHSACQFVMSFDLFIVPTSSQGSLIFSSKASAFSFMLSKFHVILRYTFRKPALDKILKHQLVVLFAFDLTCCAAGQEETQHAMFHELGWGSYTWLCQGCWSQLSPWLDWKIPGRLTKHTFGTFVLVLPEMTDMWREQSGEDLPWSCAVVLSNNLGF